MTRAGYSPALVLSCERSCLAPAIRVEPGLLRAARALLPPEATDTGTEADAGSHSAVLSQNSVAWTLDPDKLRAWRERFLTLPREVQQRFVALLRQWHGGEQKPFGVMLRQWHGSLPPEILAEELWALAEQPPAKQVAVSIFDAEERRALRNFFLRAVRGIDQVLHRGVPLDTAVDGWFRRFEARLPESIWQHPDLGEPLRRAWAVVHRNDGSTKSPPGLDASALRDLFPAKAYFPRRWRLWQVDNRIEVLPAEVCSNGGPPLPRPQSGEYAVGSVLAEMIIAAPRLTISSAHQSGRAHDLKPAGGTSIKLPDAAAITITSDCEQLQVATIQRPAWAKRMGRDAYGLFTEVEFKGITQRVRWLAPGKFNLGLPEIELGTQLRPPAWASAWGQDEYGLYAEFEYKGISQRMRRIAPSRFKMGSPETEAQRDGDELRHEVSLEAYWIADTACTQELWQAVTGHNPSHFKDDTDGKSPKRPVEQVSWVDSVQFCGKLNEALGEVGNDGQVFRLPTEAEWENACRSGTELPFSFGEDVTPDQVNYDGNYPYCGGDKGKYRAKPVAVKELPANPWGIYELHGNVLEWCQDWYEPYEERTVVDPKGPDMGERRVLRGGSWINAARIARSAFRGSREPGYRGGYVGVRLVRGQQTSKPSESGTTERHRSREGSSRVRY